MTFTKRLPVRTRLHARGAASSPFREKAHYTRPELALPCALLYSGQSNTEPMKNDLEPIRSAKGLRVSAPVEKTVGDVIAESLLTQGIKRA